MKPIEMRLRDVKRERKFQSRAELTEDRIAQYAEAYEQGDELPPLEAVGSPDEAWLIDGFHRAIARERLGLKTCLVLVHAGGRDEALKRAVAANSSQDNNGLPRTNADKRRAAEMYLATEEGKAMSSRAVGEVCHVHCTLVQKLRREQVQINGTCQRVQGKDGKTYPATRPDVENKSSKKGAVVQKRPSPLARSASNKQSGTRPASGLTSEQESQVRRLYPYRTWEQLCDEVGAKRHQVQRVVKRLGLSKPKKLKANPLEEVENFLGSVTRGADRHVGEDATTARYGATRAQYDVAIEAEKKARKALSSLRRQLHKEQEESL